MNFKRFAIVALFTFTFTPLLLAQNGELLPSPPPTFPLTPVPADSIVIDDFFWNGQFQFVKQAFPQLKATPWTITEKDIKKTQKQIAKWPQLCKEIHITGHIPSSKKHPLYSAVSIAQSNALMGLITGEGKYLDLTERAYYNSICNYQKSNQPKIAQLAAQAVMEWPRYAMTTSGNHIYINMYMRGEAHIKTDVLDLVLMNTTSTPWFYQSLFQFTFLNEQHHVVLHLRLPEWLDNHPLLDYKMEEIRQKVIVKLNGNRLKTKTQNGYLIVEAEVSDDDVLILEMQTPIRRVYDNSGSSTVALQKGPLLYSFLNFPAEGRIRTQDLIHSAFDKHRHTNVLSGTSYDAQGKPTETYQAEPYVYNRDSTRSRLFVPLDQQ